MKNTRIIYSLLLASFLILSCKGVEKTEPATKNTKPVKIENFPQIDPANQDPYFIETETTTSLNGPKSITRNMIQDSKGNIWLATWEGILRYDGQCFTNFTNQAGLRKFHAFTALEDRKGNLWFGTIGAGVYRYDGQTFTNFTTKDGLASDRLGCIYEDDKGVIWFGTDGGISKYDGKIFQNFTTKEGLLDNDINSIIQDETGKFWIGTRGETCTYDGKTFTRFTNAEGGPFVNVRCITIDQEGAIWLGGNNGLWRYRDTTLTNFDTNFVGYIYEDRQGNIWTSSAVESEINTWALSRYDKRPFPYENPTGTIIKKADNMFFGILEDKDGGIWWGSLRGVCRFFEGGFDCFGDN